IEYTISYNLDGGTLSGALDKFTVNDLPYVLPTPTKVGYNFVGWFTAQNCGTQVTEISKDAPHNVTVYAKWEEINRTYRITYHFNGGTPVYNSKAEIKSILLQDLSLFTGKTITSENFMGDTYGVRDQVVAFFHTNPTYKAKWGWLYNYLVDYAQKDGYSDIGPLINITADNHHSYLRAHLYAFLNDDIYGGWPYSADFAKLEAEELMWIHLSGPTTFKADTELTLITPIRSGYRFAGWYLNPEFKGVPITKVNVGTTIDLDLYAKWVKEGEYETFHIDYMVEEELLTNHKVLFTEQDLPYTIPSVTKPCHKFLGWYLDENYTMPVTQITTTGNKVLYAKWEEAVTYLTVLEARNAQNNEVVEVRGIVTGKIGNSFFLQDSTAGVYVYMGSDSKFNDKLIIGNDVVVTGKRSLYNQLVQISNVTSVEVLNTNVQLPAIKTYETLDPQELLNVQGQRVSIPNLTIASIPVIGTGSYSVVVSSGSTTVEIRIDQYVEDFAEIKEFFQGMVVGQGIDVEGVFAGRFNQTVQLMVTDVNQLKAKPITKELFTSLLENKLNPGQNIVDNLNLQTSIVIAGTTYQVTWQSSNPEVINPDGTVVRPEIGEDDVNVVLTVKTTFNDEEITITFEVTVLAKRDSSQVITYVETFDNFTSTSKNYVNGVFVGVNGIEWEYNALRGDLDDYSIKGKGVMFGNQTEHKDGVSFLKATISGGIGDFKVDTLKAFTSGTERKLGLYINGELKGEFTLDNSVTTVQVFEVKGINVSGTFTL
ncbi:MAG: hypothetical protein GX203_01745, partial [Acholeplasmataceae bacterium]|nr:hypothetical protein [Acholeplasmataceae bacterium]